MARRKHVPCLSDSFANLCRSWLDAQKEEKGHVCLRCRELGPSEPWEAGLRGAAWTRRGQICRLRVRVAEAYSWKRLSVALIAADQIHPSAERPTLSKESPPSCVGRTSVAQAAGTCRHTQNFAFLTACLEPPSRWGLTFRVVRFVTWGAFFIMPHVKAALCLVTLAPQHVSQVS